LNKYAVIGSQTACWTSLRQHCASSRGLGHAPKWTSPELRGIGGAVHDVDAAETAYAHRHQEVLATVPIFPPSAGDELDEAFRHLEPHVDGAYQNFESRPDERSGGSASRYPAWSRRGRDDRSWTAVQD
jgi:hypothetical protein